MAVTKDGSLGYQIHKLLRDRGPLFQYSRITALLQIAKRVT
jgi:hypothetical protein